MNKLNTVSIIKYANVLLAERYGSDIQIRSRQIYAIVESIVCAINDNFEFNELKKQK